MAIQRLVRPARQALRALPLSSTASAHVLCRCQQQRPSIVFYSTSSSSSSPSTQQPAPSDADDGVRHSGPIDPLQDSELQLGELPGGTFRIEPLRRVGEDIVTTRARLLCMFLPRFWHL